MRASTIGSRTPLLALIAAQFVADSSPIRRRISLVEPMVIDVEFSLLKRQSGWDRPVLLLRGGRFYAGFPLERPV